MIATLSFTLPEEVREHRLAIDGWKWSSAMWELDQKLRSMSKYEDKDTISIEMARTLIYREMEDRGLNFDEQ